MGYQYRLFAVTAAVATRTSTPRRLAEGTQTY
jgi:hypothetical protein